MKKVLSFCFIAFLVSTAALAQQADIPLRDWTVPSSASSAGGYTTMVDVTSPRLFIGIAVCRLLDTRVGTVYPLDGDGKYTANQTRIYDLDGACGIPAGADAVSLNITVTETDANPFGHIKIWPGGQSEPTVSTLNWSAGNQTLANAAIVA